MPSLTCISRVNYLLFLMPSRFKELKTGSFWRSPNTWVATTSERSPSTPPKVSFADSLLQTLATPFLCQSAPKLSEESLMLLESPSTKEVPLRQTSTDQFTETRHLSSNRVQELRCSLLVSNNPKTTVKAFCFRSMLCSAHFEMW